VLKLLSMAITAANKANVPIAVCGEMAGEVRMTRLLLGFGLRNLSMHPAHLLTVKQRVLMTNVEELHPLVDRIRRNDNPAKVVALLQKLNL
jgi:phosphotransferase system enzyme I (PtsI)